LQNRVIQPAIQRDDGPIAVGHGGKVDDQVVLVGMKGALFHNLPHQGSSNTTYAKENYWKLAHQPGPFLCDVHATANMGGIIP